jgi:SAM-dependent methyltransferase
MIEHTNLEAYANPVSYDIINDSFEPQGSFYLALAQKVGGPVLELGCGTGRVTIPLARQGVNITGLDIVPGMLAQARRKAEGLPIRWVEADARTFHLATQFDLIFTTGATFQHLLTRPDQEATLARVRQHLAPEGYFAFDILLARPKMMINVEEERAWFSYVDEHGQSVSVSGTDYYDPIRQIRHETAYYRWHNEQGEEITRRERLVLRYIFPQEMEALLHYNGFEVLHCYADWGQSPPTDNSRTLVYTCTRVM